MIFVSPEDEGDSSSFWLNGATSQTPDTVVWCSQNQARSATLKKLPWLKGHPGNRSGCLAIDLGSEGGLSVQKCDKALRPICEVEKIYEKNNLQFWCKQLFMEHVIFTYEDFV